MSKIEVFSLHSLKYLHQLHEIFTCNMKTILCLVTIVIMAKALPMGDLSKYQQRKMWALNAFKIIGQAMKESAKDLQDNNKEEQINNQMQDIDISPFAAFYPIQNEREHFENDILADIQALAQETLKAQIPKRPSLKKKVSPHPIPWIIG